MKSAFRKIFTKCLGLCIAACLVLCGCQWKPLSDPPDTDTLPADAKPDTSRSDTEALPPPVVYYHALTGLACEESLSLARPVAFFLDNTQSGVSQLGTSLADVLIEAPVDNGTRFAALITDLDAAATIGPIRSARSWLMDAVRSFDAVAVYHGTSDTFGEAPDVYPGVDSIDYAQNTNGDIFYKDPAIIAPYQVKTSGDRIQNALQNSSWRTEINPNIKPYFWQMEKTPILREEIPHTASAVPLHPPRSLNTFTIPSPKPICAIRTERRTPTAATESNWNSRILYFCFVTSIPIPLQAALCIP